MTSAPGLMVGFGDLIGEVTLADVKAHGFTIPRLTSNKPDPRDQHHAKNMATPERVAELAQEVVSAGLQPLMSLVRAEQVALLPGGTLVEAGNEGDVEKFGWEPKTTDKYAKEFDRIWRACDAHPHKLKCYGGVVSNPHRRGLDFLKTIPWASIPKHVGCSIHWYPVGNGPPTKGHDGRTRAEEVVAVRKIVGDGRPMIVSEIGYHSNGYTDQQIAENFAWERKFWSEQVFEVVVAYQINDGPPTDTSNDARYGFRRFATGEWKPVAAAFTRSSQSHAPAPTPVPPAPPAQPAPPENTMTTVPVHFKTHDGTHYLCAESGGGREVVANRTDPGPWETFHVADIGDGQCSIRADNGQYVCAELDGTVNANRDAVGPWETWTYEQRDGRVAFKSAHSQYLCAETGGGGVVVANRSAIGVWELFSPSAWFADAEPESPVPSLKGPLTLVKAASGFDVPTDETGDVLPVFIHDGSDFSDWVWGKKSEVEARTKLERKAGYVGKRPFTILGYYDQNRPDQPNQWKAWAGRECTPIGFTAYSGRKIEATPNYYDQKREYLTMLADYGMTILDDRGDMVAFTPSQAIEHMRVNGLLFNSMGATGRQVLAGLQAGNEWWQNGPAGKETPELCGQMLEAFKAGAGWWPSMRGLSVPPNSSEEPDALIAWGKAPATVMSVNGSRAVNSHLVAHYFNYGRDVRPKTGQLFLSIEPIGDGLGVSVGRTNDAETLAAIATVCLISGTIPVHMSGRGVWGEQGPDGPGGLDKQAGFWEVPKIPTYLPKDVMRFPVVGHSGEGQRHRFIEAGKTEGTPRIDYAIDPGTGRFAAVQHAWTWQPVKMLKNCKQLKVTNLLTGAVERDGPIGVGATLDHRYHRARLLTGVIG